MADFKIKISSGELIDRLTILEIKISKIKDNGKLYILKKEYDELNSHYQKLHIKYGKKIDILKKNLSNLNLKLWNTENFIRKHEAHKDFGEKFIKLARTVYITNDKRSKLKNKINILTSSSLREVKQYSDYR